MNNVLGFISGQLVAITGMDEAYAELAAIGLLIWAAAMAGVAMSYILWRNRRQVLRNRELKVSPVVRPGIPGFNILKALRLPTPKVRLSLSSGKGIAVSVLTVVIGFSLAITFVIAGTPDSNPHWPEPGAAYALGSVNGTIGDPLEPDIETPSVKSHTLKINLKDGIRIENLVFDGMDFGKTGLTECFQITRTPSTTGFLYGDVLHVTGTSSFPTVDMATMEVYELHLGGSVDGHTVEGTMSNTVSDQVVESMRDVSSYTGDGTVDRVILNLAGSATVRNFIIKDSSCSVGSLDLAFAKFGKVQFDSTVRVGDGTGVTASSFVVNSTVQYKTMVDTLIDSPIHVR